MMKKSITRLSVTLITLFSLTLILFAFTQDYVSAKARTLVEGKSTKVVFGKSAADKVLYYKVTPRKTGALEFSLSSGYSGYVALCNSKKKVISSWSLDKGWVWGGSDHPHFRHMFFGVKKGVTYYIKVDGSSYLKDKKGRYVGYVQCSSKKLSASKYGTKKSKAKAIKKKKTAKGLFIAGSSRKGKWYKITNSKKNTYITFKAPKTNGRFKLTFYYKSYGKWYKSTYYASRSDSAVTFKGYISKKVKHTYYMKVFPEGKSSGTYSIKWK